MANNTMVMEEHTPPDNNLKIAKAPRHDFTTPLKILLVEDNASDAELIGLALDAVDIPYSLEQLYRGTDVIPYLMRKCHSASEHSPDLILLDLGLPGEDGFEILAEISAMRGTIHDTPIAILTGYEHFGYIRKSYELCITDYLTKPCNLDVLRKLLVRIAYH